VRRAWGKVHLMRPGKRAHIDEIKDLYQDEAVHGTSEPLGLEDTELGIELDALNNSNLRRVSRWSL
jgi:hypothetical protein